MIHCKILDRIADDLVSESGYDKELLFVSHGDRQSCDLKTWFTIKCLQKNFEMQEIADYLDKHRRSVQYYYHRHGKRLKEEDYQLKWELIDQL